jgi:cell division protein FtsB
MSIGTYVSSTSSYYIMLAFSSSHTYKVYFNNSGNGYAAGWLSSSDAKLKTNIKTLPYKGRLEPKHYNKEGKDEYGFVAQDVQKLYPDAVLAGVDDILYLNYGSLTAVVSAQVNKLEDEFEELKPKYNATVKELKDLKTKHDSTIRELKELKAKYVSLEKRQAKLEEALNLLIAGN